MGGKRREQEERTEETLVGMKNKLIKKNSLIGLNSNKELCCFRGPRSVS